jgi:hypothetical protein
MNWRSPLSATGWFPAGTPLDWELVGEISMPRVRTTDTKENGTRGRLRGAVEPRVEARWPAAGALNEVRVSCISVLRRPWLIIHQWFARHPLLSLSRARELTTSRCRSEALPPVFGRTRPGRTWPNDAFSPWWPPRIGVES